MGGEIQGMIQRLFNQRCALESQFLNIHLANYMSVAILCDLFGMVPSEPFKFEGFFQYI